MKRRGFFAALLGAPMAAWAYIAAPKPHVLVARLTLDTSDWDAMLARCKAIHHEAERGISVRAGLPPNTLTQIIEGDLPTEEKRRQIALQFT